MTTIDQSPTPSLQQRLQWFLDARFGIFVHFGCYAVTGRGEQIMIRDMIPQAEYETLAQDFCPEPDWAKRLAAATKAAGARYIVLTTRHHDGYCLFETKSHNFHAAATGPGRDLIAEYVQAAREEGLGIGFYYSVHSWRWPGFFDPQGHPEDLPRMVEEMHIQVEELMTNYGRIDVLWYDVPSVPGENVPGNFGWEGTAIEQSAADFYRSAELNAKVRELQPHILINDRSGLPEDFGTPEQHVTPAEGGRAWEACMTLNFAPGWGWIDHPMATKTHGQILWHMLDAVRQGGNFLFNVGPQASGYLAQRDLDFMQELGRWLSLHGDAVFGTRPGDIYPRGSWQGACFHYGMFTEREHKAWLSLFYYPAGGDLILSRLEPEPIAAKLLTTGETLHIEALANRRWRLRGLPETPPDSLAAVVEITFAGKPRLSGIKDGSWLAGF